MLMFTYVISSDLVAIIKMMQIHDCVICYLLLSSGLFVSHNVFFRWFFARDTVVHTMRICWKCKRRCKQTIICLLNVEKSVVAICECVLEIKHHFTTSMLWRNASFRRFKMHLLLFAFEMVLLFLIVWI